MDVREKMVKLLEGAFDCFIDDPYCIPDEKEFADHLIANGVTVQQWTPASEPPKNGKEYLCRCIVNGMDDGSFAPKNNITRAEVVSVTCKLLERNADQAFIDANFANLPNTFSDINKGH